MMIRLVSVIAVFLVLLLACYALARAYLAYEVATARQMLNDLGAIKIGDSEASVLPVLRKYDGYREPIMWRQLDKTDYEYVAEIGPAGTYYLIDRTHTRMAYRAMRAFLSSLNPRLRRAIGLRRWNVYGRVGFKEDRVATAYGMVMVEGNDEWLSGEWYLVGTIPETEIDRFVISPGHPWPHRGHYLVGWANTIRFESEGWGGAGAEVWITPSATEGEQRSVHEFRLQCLTSRAACQTVCDLYPAAEEYPRLPGEHCPWR